MTHPNNRPVVDMSRYPALGGEVVPQHQAGPVEHYTGQQAQNPNTNPVTVHVHLGGQQEAQQTQQQPAYPHAPHNMVPVRVPMPGHPYANPGYGHRESMLSRLLPGRFARRGAVLAVGAMLLNSAFTAATQDSYRERLSTQFKEGEVKSLAQSVWNEVPVVGDGNEPAAAVMPTAWSKDETLASVTVTGKLYPRIEIKGLEGPNLATTATIEFTAEKPLTAVITGRLDEPEKTIEPVQNALIDRTDYLIDRREPNYNITVTGVVPTKGAPIIKNGPLTKWSEADLKKINESLDKLYKNYFFDTGKNRLITQMAAAAIDNREGSNPCMETAVKKADELLIKSIKDKAAAQMPPVIIAPETQFKVEGDIPSLKAEYIKTLPLTPVTTIVNGTIPAEMNATVGFLDPNNITDTNVVDESLAISGLTCTITPPKPPAAK